MRIIFITGISRGLGAALTKELTKDDTQIIGFSRSKGEFEGIFHSCDFSKPQLAVSIFDQAFEEADLKNAASITFINNAGQLGPLDFIERLDITDIQENLTANLLGSAIALSHFLKYTKQLDKPKLFLQISSGVALPERAKPGWSLYCAAKAGQEQLIRTVALEQSHVPHPAKVLNINPGVMETAMQQLIRSTPKSAFPGVDRFIQMKEEGKVVDPKIIAARIAAAIEDYDSLENGKTYVQAEFQAN